jgi:hypothetical protein
LATVVQIGTELTDDREYGDTSRLVAAFELLRESDAIDSVRVHAEDNQVRAMSTGHRERLLCGGRTGDAAVLPSETRLHESQHVDVVGYQHQTVWQTEVSHAELGCDLTSPFRGTGGGGAGSLGEHVVNEDPRWTVGGLPASVSRESEEKKRLREYQG